MKVIGWRAWYDDGQVFHSKAARWEDLPDDGVVSIVLYFDRLTSGGHPERRVMDGDSYYFRADGPAGPVYGSGEDPPDVIRARYNNPSIKRGRWTDEETMHRIQADAMAAKEF